ncbi:MAG: hypothetical protein ACI8Z1_001739 [Candidatus Azotimanducaceae bacterium]|jgi:hypothetical protein
MKFRPRLLLTTLVLFFVLPASATPVFTWTKLTSESDVINNGSVLRATNLGSSGQNTFNPVTLNGIDFDTDTTGLSGLTPGGGDFNTEALFVGTPMDEMLSGTWYAPGGSSSLSLTGLTAGEDYIYQMFLSNDQNGTGHASRVTFQGQAFNLSPTIYPYGGGGYSLQVDFTANTSSELVTFGTGSGSEVQRMQFNAFTLQGESVPGPASLLLLIAGLAGLLIKRR